MCAGWGGLFDPKRALQPINFNESIFFKSLKILQNPNNFESEKIRIIHSLENLSNSFKISLTLSNSAEICQHLLIVHYLQILFSMSTMSTVYTMSTLSTMSNKNMWKTNMLWDKQTMTHLLSDRIQLYVLCIVQRKG